MTTKAPYPTPTVNDTSGIFEFMRYTNNVTDGLMFPMILGIIWIVTFIGTKSFSTSRAFTIASFVSMVLSIPLAVMEFIAPNYAYLTIIFTALGALWLKLDTP
jgi:hypothetical protein